jgi:hypothetical protein
VEFTIIPLKDPEGHMDGMAAIMRDVTKRFEEVRVQAEVGCGHQNRTGLTAPESTIALGADRRTSTRRAINPSSSAPGPIGWRTLRIRPQEAECGQDHLRPIYRSAGRQRRLKVER